ncbi:MAG: hypothetical protein A2X61_00435 [Ignavibacteria bacterium GWB2_35_12]|nr:MAG: hypothetical protein A2X61_00435 [Ignavibacteria bacterium GWB2_35_12]OGU90558.1 MAG: hypothetical protein A2220_12770 [Ignavibacteria bacterium RIFOXYA2_FULL_35_10]OGV23312.1 MAG: hypothetical protein A2475_06610 [Ignavibacteria bacterium RIFOXYC2_FULL_35_21]
MKIKFFILLILFFISSALYAEQNNIVSGEKLIKDKLNALQGTSNEGKEFWLTFNPSLESPGFGNGNKIFIYSQFETKVILEIPGKGYTQQIYIYPNEVKEILLPVSAAQCYRKNADQKPLDEIYYEGNGIHLYADKPILVYALTIYYRGSDGYIAMPITAYGKNYVVSSWYDVSDNSTLYYPGYVAVIAPYDKTTVNFTLGGNPSTRTNTGLIPGGVLKKTLFKGDVLLLSSSGNMADLSGSRISATKPVVVISGNYFTHIPLNQNYSDDLLTDIELPTFTWDNQYLITPFFDREHLPVIRIYAKEPNTIVYRDNIVLDTLTMSTYMENDGFITITDNLTSASPTLISADKPIYVKLYNRSQDEDGVPGGPFMLSAIPFRQQLKEYTFCTAGVTNTSSFENYYLNLAYIPDDSFKVPLDFELGTVTTDSVSWQTLRSYDPAPGVQFSVPVNDKYYYSKTIEIRQEGMYKIRANQPFPAYIYGTSPNLAYGHPAGQNYLDIEKNDTLPPEPQFDIDCDGSVYQAYIEDMPRTNPSKLLEIEIDTLQSYNYNFTYNNFVPGEDYRTRWDATVIDKSNDAEAVITFRDRSGNDTTLTLSYKPGKLTFSPTLDFGEVPVGKTVNKDFRIVNNSDKNSFTITKYKLRNNNQGYELLTTNLPITLAPLDSVKFTLRFKSPGCGVYQDVVEIGDSCFLASNNTATALSYVLTAKPDIDFGNLPVGTYSDKNIFIYNESIISARLDSIALMYGNVGFTLYINNPNQIISPFDSVRASVRFTSTVPGSFTDSLGAGDSCGYHFRLECKANSFKVSVQPNLLFGRLMPGDDVEKEAWVVNESDQYTFTLDTLVFKNNTQGFEFRDITFPYIIPPTEAAHFYVAFKATEEGTFTDSIGISSSNLLAYNSEVKADVISSVEEIPMNGDCQNELCIESINPNPSGGSSVDVILTKKIAGEIELCIYNEIGDAVTTSKLETISQGRFLIKINIGNLQSGVYFIECKTGYKSTREKFLITR